MTTKTSILQPVDPYDTPAWEAFYAANPGWRRGVGAEGVNDGGEGGDDEAAEKAKEGADRKAEEEKNKGGKGTTDEEAKLLKEVMQKKEALKKAQEEIDALKKSIDGIDLDEARELKAAKIKADEEKTKAEEDAALARGEFDRVKAKLVDTHQKALKEKDDDIAAKDATIAKLQNEVHELAVGRDFGDSGFIKEKTVLTPRLARQLFGAHFDVVDGAVVAYDKPRGAADRTPIPAADGKPLSFEAAIEHLVTSSPDKDSLLKATMKPGAGSTTTPGGKKEGGVDDKLSRAERIAAGLAKLPRHNPT